MIPLGIVSARIAVEISGLHSLSFGGSLPHTSLRSCSGRSALRTPKPACCAPRSHWMELFSRLPNRFLSEHPLSKFSLRRFRTRVAGAREVGVLIVSARSASHANERPAAPEGVFNMLNKRPNFGVRGGADGARPLVA